MVRQAIIQSIRATALFCLWAFGCAGVYAQSADPKAVEAQLSQLLLDYKFGEGSALAEQLVNSVAAQFGEEQLASAAAMNRLGVFRQAASRYREAEELHAKALAIREKLLGPDDPSVAESLENLALAYDSQAQTAAAEPLFKRALDIRERVLGGDSPLVATSLADLGMFYIYTQARYDDAEPLLKRALAIREKSLGPNHRDTATSLLYLGKLSHERGAYSEANQLYGRALTTYSLSVGAEHPEVARTLLNLATLYVQQGRTAEAETHLKRALGVYEQVLGPDDERAALCLNSLANLYRMQGRFGDAEPLVARSLSIQEKLLGPDHPDVARTLTNLAALNQVQGHFADAEKRYLRALEIREKRLGANNPEVGVTLTRLASFYQYVGRNNDAEVYANRAIKIRQAALGEKHADVGLSISVLAGIYDKKGKRKDAEVYYRKALEIQEAALGPHQLEVAITKHNLGALCKVDGRLSEADVFLQAALAVREKLLAPDHTAVLDTLLQLAELRRLQGAADEARKLFDRARGLSRSSLKEVPVYFATDRNKEGSNEVVAFGNKRALRGQVTMGVAKVTLPAVVKKAASIESIKDENTDVGRLAIQPIEIKSSPDLTLTADYSLLQARFFKGQAFVFIHGYNVSFENSVRRTAQIAHDLDFDGPAYLFSWPSRGQFWGYLADRDEVDIAAEHLKQFLQGVVLSTKATKIHVVAHSMGNMVLLRALEKVREDNPREAIPLGEIITAAPDVDPDLFAAFAAKAAAKGAHVTLYVSSDDLALWISGWLRAGRRAGYVNGTPVPVKDAETIDITGVPSASLFALNHDVYASTPLIVGDMRALLMGERPPEARTREFRRVTLDDGVYWKYQAQTLAATK